MPCIRKDNRRLRAAQLRISGLARGGEVLTVADKVSRRAREWAKIGLDNR